MSQKNEMTFAEAHKWLRQALEDNRKNYDSITIKAIEKALFALAIAEVEEAFYKILMEVHND